MRRRLATSARLLALIALLAAATPVTTSALFPAAARAAGGVAGFTFGAVPVQKPHTPASSYFSLSLRSGETVHEAITVSNHLKTAAIDLKLGAASGSTASNSGYTYTGAFSGCKGAACWITGLPPTITVPAGGQVRVPFTITVPAGTADSQYLAGISIEPVQKPSATRLGGNGVGAGATVVHEVNIGVAVTVGDVTALSRALEITYVLATHVGTTPRLLINEHDVGQTFVSATGDTICLANGQTYTFKTTSLTILPGDTATLEVNAPGLPSGTNDNCSVSLDYGGVTAAVWHGTVKVPKPHVTKLIHVGPGVYSAIPKAKIKKSIPTLVIVGGAVAAAAILALIAALVILLNGGSAGGGAGGGGAILGGGGGGTGGGGAGVAAAEGGAMPALTAAEIAGGAGGLAAGAAALGAVAQRAGDGGEASAGGEAAASSEVSGVEDAQAAPDAIDVMIGAGDDRDDRDETTTNGENPPVPEGTPLPLTSPPPVRSDAGRDQGR